MIAAAERIAAEAGLGVMSLRSVQAAAGQRNKSAAQFHFGSRDGLIDAVIEARMGPINVCRTAMLAELDGRSVPPTRRDLVAALVEPLAAATLAPGSCWARFLAQGVADPRLSDQVRGHVEGASFRAVRDRIVASLDHVPEPLRTGRVDQAVGVAVALLAAAEARPRRRTSSRLPDAVLVADLIDACVGVLDADSSLETRTALERMTAAPTRRAGRSERN